MRPPVADELIDFEGNLRDPSLCDAMRGTNFIVGRRWLGDHGLEQMYLDALAPPVREHVLGAVASEWVPMDIVLAHYVSLDALPLSHEQRIELGASVSRTINGVVLATIARLAGTMGLSPFVPLARAAKLFARNYRGGAVAVYKVGPNEARFEVLGAPMAISSCHRENVEGALFDGARPFAAHLRVTEIASRRTSLSYAYRLRW
jgi:hypothetical protein